MNASKENAVEARQRLIRLSDLLGSELRNKHSATVIFVEELLEAAAKRLPSEAAIARDRQRKRTKAG